MKISSIPLHSTSQLMDEIVAHAKQLDMFSYDILQNFQNYTPDRFGLYIKSNTIYIADDYDQNIKSVYALIKSKTGDCKSLSVAMSQFLTFKNIPNGLVFVGKDEITHVFNYFIDEYNNIKYIDLTLPNFNNLANYKFNYQKIKLIPICKR